MNAPLLLIALLFSSLARGGQASGLDADWAEYYRYEVKYLQNRYSGFLEVGKRNKEFERRRMAGIDKVKERRKKEQDAYEQSRRRFVEMRKKMVTVDQDAVERIREAAKAKEDARREKLRLRYIEQKKQIEEKLARIPKIPENQDVGLEEPSL